MVRLYLILRHVAQHSEQVLYSGHFHVEQVLRCQTSHWIFLALFQHRFNREVHQFRITGINTRVSVILEGTL